MKQSDIERIEAELSCKLPKGYRKFLLNRTGEIEELAELMPLRVMFWTEADEIIDENRRRHASPEDMPIGAEATPWPDSYFVVGTNGAADYWFIDLGAERRGIWSYQHEMQDIELHYDHFGEWMDDLRQDAKTPEDWQ